METMTYLIIADFDGKMTLKLIEQGVDPSDIYVWEDSAKGKYCVRMEGATVTDNLDDFDGMKFDVVIGNPPYGSGGNLAIRFLNKCADLSDDIRLVMPVSIRKPSSQNKVRLDLICIEDVTLPDTTFGKTIKTVRQRWVKTDTLREKIQTFTTHPDFQFVKKQDADCMIFRCGASTGKLTFEFDDNKPDHYYIKASAEVIRKLTDIQDELITISKEQNGMPGISKHDLITTYIRRYGREKIRMNYSHPDLEFVDYDDRESANVFIGIKGGGPAGRVKTENFTHYADTGHHLIRCSKEVQERLVALEPQFREEALITQVPSLGKNELISIYMKNHPIS